MCADLKNTSTHRRSMVPHISDEILRSSSYNSLREVRLVGACLVTDVGACAIVQSCPQITILYVSYCNGITDKLLIRLGETSRQLLSLCVSGCMKIGDKGLVALAAGCPLITRLELAGCAKVTDTGIAAIAKLKFLEHLNLRNCDQVSDRGLCALAKTGFNLRVLDITGLDLVSEKGLVALAATARCLTALYATSCNVAPHQFGSALRDNLPLALPGMCLGSLTR